MDGVSPANLSRWPRDRFTQLFGLLLLTTKIKGWIERQERINPTGRSARPGAAPCIGLSSRSFSSHQLAVAAPGARQQHVGFVLGEPAWRTGALEIMHPLPTASAPRCCIYRCRCRGSVWLGVSLEGHATASTAARPAIGSNSRAWLLLSRSYMHVTSHPGQPNTRLSCASSAERPIGSVPAQALSRGPGRRGRPLSKPQRIPRPAMPLVRVGRQAVLAPLVRSVTTGAMSTPTPVMRIESSSVWRRHRRSRSGLRDLHHPRP